MGEGREGEGLARARAEPARTAPYRARAALAALAYAALAAHMLFIPYNYAPLSFGEGLEKFSQIHWLTLGSDQNVALVSRALTFFPLGLLLAVALVPRASAGARFSAALAAIVLGSACALAINFAQVWFPGRTVSLNNLVAEAAGIAIGALGWSAWGSAALQWWRSLNAGGHLSLRAVLGGYALLYLFASLAPFDFVTNSAELAEKLASRLYAWWMIPSGCGRVPCSIKYLVGFVAVVPCGWWFASRWPTAAKTVVRALVVAVALSSIIELLRLFMVSGVSQGATVLVRALGFVIGVQVYARRATLHAVQWTRFARPAVLMLLPFYLMVVAYVAGWLRVRFVGISEGLARLDSFVWMPPPTYRGDVIVWLPFYYQYFEDYQSTMHSTILHAALYVPVGAACWLWARQRDRVPLLSAATLAAGLALAAESSKLFLARRHPDYTDVFIAIAAATATLFVLRFVARTQQRAPVLTATSEPDRPAGSPTRSAGVQRAQPGIVSAGNAAEPVARVNVSGRIAGGLALAIAAWTVFDFPIWRWALALGLVGYAVLLVRRPLAYLIAIPALLPVLDLAPWSGRFFWDEFDALLATTVGTRLLTGLPPQRMTIRLPRFALGMLALSIAISTAIGVWPLAPLDANAFTNYLSPYNALRVAKGYVWAALIVWLVVRDVEAGRWAISRLIVAGLAAGLAAAAAGVFWERFAFLGTQGMDASFRAAGMVSSTHVGGAYLEAILVLLTPFALATAVAARGITRRILGAAALIAGAMALLMTVSRAGAAAWAVAVVGFLVVWLWASARERAPVRGGVAWAAAGAVLLALATSTATVQLGFLGERMKAAAAGLSQRAAHWHAALDLVPRDAASVLLGTGLGTFPREFYLARGSELQLPAYRIEAQSGQAPSRLVLAGGRGMYIDQRVDAAPGSELRLSGLVRASKPGASLRLGLCAKSFLNSTDCTGVSIPAEAQWREFSASVAAPRTGSGPLGRTPPIALSVYNPAFGSMVEVTRLSLRDADRQLLANGTFGAGLDRWLMTSDLHLAWRALSTPVQILVEQGLLGGLAALAVCIAAIAAVRRRLGRDAAIVALLAAGLGFAVAAMFDSLLDMPRLVLLVAIAACAAIVTNRSGEAPAASGRARS